MLISEEISGNILFLQSEKETLLFLGGDLTPIFSESRVSSILYLPGSVTEWWARGVLAHKK